MSARVKVVAAAGLFVFAAGHGSFGHGHASPAGRTEAASAHRIAANGPRNERLAMEMAAAAGWGRGQRRCLDLLWTRESAGTWSPTVSNYQGSGAYGIPQALPGSKMASAGPDWRTSPRTQIRWGLGYIRSRYGTPCGAWAHETADSWY